MEATKNTRNSVEQKKVKGIIKNVAINTSDFFFPFSVLFFYFIPSECFQFLYVSFQLYGYHLIRTLAYTVHTHTPSLRGHIFQTKRHPATNLRQTVQAFTYFIATFIDWPLSIPFAPIIRQHTFMNVPVPVPWCSSFCNVEKFSLSFLLGVDMFEANLFTHSFIHSFRFP